MCIRLFRYLKIIVLIIFIVNTLIVSAFSTSHLVPEEGLHGTRMFNPYYEAVGNRLLPSNYHRICQVVVFPSFSEEYAVYILYDKEKPSISPIVVSLKFERQLWSEMHVVLESSAEKKQLHITEPDAQRYALSKIRSDVIRNEAPIDLKVVSLLENVWVNMLSQVRYPEKNKNGLDGVRYHFATFKEREGYLTGQAWSPSKGTIVYDLVELVNYLGEYSSAKEKDRTRNSQNLQRMAENLLDRIEHNK